MSKVKLTAEQQAALSHAPFEGLPPGSNFWPMVDVAPEGERLFPGEVVDGLLRLGMLSAEPLAKARPGARGGDFGPYGVIPDLEVTHRYVLTPAGRSALGGLRDG